MAGGPETGGSAQPVRYSCRVRAADGTWRYVETTLSRHRSQGAPDRLLVTSRDVSDQVALRRQIAHLTYHDGLTGLPNRAYLEERAREALGHPGTGVRARGPGHGEPGRARGHPGRPGRVHQRQRRRGAQRGRPGPGPGGAAAAGRRAAPGHGGALGRRRVRGPDAGRRRPPRRSSSWPERILASVAAEPFRAADRSVSLSASVGVALADGSPAGYVWRNADAAVSRAKESGGGRLEVFPALPPRGTQRRLDLVAQLSRALASQAASSARASPARVSSSQNAPAMARAGPDSLADQQLSEGRLETGVPAPRRPGQLPGRRRRGAAPLARGRGCRAAPGVPGRGRGRPGGRSSWATGCCASPAPRRPPGGRTAGRPACGCAARRGPGDGAVQRLRAGRAGRAAGCPRPPSSWRSPPRCWPRGATRCCAALVSCASAASGWPWTSPVPDTARWPG